jgi:hypothetical protein
MRTLTDIRRTNTHYRPLKFGLTKDLYGRRSLLWITKRIANIFDSTGNANATT